MKKIFAVFAVLVAAAVMLVACGGSDGGGTPAATKVTTVEQGAQTAVVGANAATNVVSSAFSLSGNIGTFPGAKFGKQTKASAALSKRVARYTAKAKKARALVISKATTTGGACTDGGTWSMTTPDPTDTTMSFSETYKNCKEYGEIYNATWKMSYSCGDAYCNAFTITMSGSSSGTYYVQDWTNSVYEYATVESKYADSGSATFSVNDTGDAYTMKLNDSGWYENYVSVPTWRDEYADSGLSLTVTGSMADPTVYTLTIKINGSTSWEYSEAGVVQSADTTNFYNLVVSDTYNSSLATDQFSIDGTMTTDQTPDACAEGTYKFDTITPITFNYNTGKYTAGELKINSTVVVKYNADGSVDISIDGGLNFTPYSDVQLNALCATL